MVDSIKIRRWLEAIRFEPTPFHFVSTSWRYLFTPGAQRRCNSGSRFFGPGSGFSLVELVLVVVIIGIIAAIAVPRISSSSEKAQANAILASLEVVRDAIDHYFAEHDRFPGYNPSNRQPEEKAFISQLTKYSNYRGEVSNTPSADYPFGPYLRKPFPTNPLNDLATVFVRETEAEQPPADGSGWVATLADGTFTINASDEQLGKVGITRMELGSDLRDGLKFDLGPRN